MSASVKNTLLWEKPLRNHSQMAFYLDRCNSKRSSNIFADKTFRVSMLLCYQFLLNAAFSVFWSPHTESAPSRLSPCQPSSKKQVSRLTVASAANFWMISPRVGCNKAYITTLVCNRHLLKVACLMMPEMPLPQWYPPCAVSSTRTWMNQPLTRVNNRNGERLLPHTLQDLESLGTFIC